MAVWSPPKLPFVWAVVTDVLLLAGDLAVSNTGAVVAMKVDTHIHRKHEAQHLDSSPEACIQAYQSSMVRSRVYPAPPTPHSGSLRLPQIGSKLVF